MQDKLAQYTGKNYKNIIDKLEVTQRTSKDGNPYYAIILTMTNGFQKMIFIDAREQFGWISAFDSLDFEKSTVL